MPKLSQGVKLLVRRQLSCPQAQPAPNSTRSLVRRREPLGGSAPLKLLIQQKRPLELGLNRVRQVRLHQAHDVGKNQHNAPIRIGAAPPARSARRTLALNIFLSKALVG